MHFHSSIRIVAEGCCHEQVFSLSVVTSWQHSSIRYRKVFGSEKEPFPDSGSELPNGIPQCLSAFCVGRPNDLSFDRARDRPV